ncbi:MAG: hypothetical protein K1X74_22990 [Pirellulales bacterium]|nr:hypothetical protein [Pirellulales bacterium]
MSSDSAIDKPEPLTGLSGTAKVILQLGTVGVLCALLVGAAAWARSMLLSMQDQQLSSQQWFQEELRAERRAQTDTVREFSKSMTELAGAVRSLHVSLQEETRATRRLIEELTKAIQRKDEP